MTLMTEPADDDDDDGGDDGEMVGTEVWNE